MAHRYEVTEMWTRIQNGGEITTTEALGYFTDIDAAKCCLRDAFDAHWDARSFPSELWVAMCRPPEESPCDALLSSRFPDEGTYRIVIC